MKLKLYILLLIFFSISIAKKSYALSFFHPVHISVVNLDLSDEKPIVFSVKLFKDDFAKILNKINHSQIQFTEDSKKEDLQPFVIAYIEDNFKINSNQEEYHLTKIKVEGLAIWLFFELNPIKKTDKKIVIQNSLMCDLYPDQTNLFIMNFMGEDKAQRFDNSTRIHQFNIRE